MDISKLNKQFNLLYETKFFKRDIITEDDRPIDKIKSLIDSGTSENIELAKQFIISQGMVDEALTELIKPEIFVSKLEQIMKDYKRDIDRGGLLNLGVTIENIVGYHDKILQLYDKWEDILRLYNDIEENVSQEVYNANENLFMKVEGEIGNMSRKIEKTIENSENIQIKLGEIEEEYKGLFFGI